MATTFTGAWPGPLYGDPAPKNSFSFDPSRNTGAWSGYFEDALSAWVTVEGMQAKTQATGAAQEATRSNVTPPIGSAGPARAGPSGFGMDPKLLVVGGLLIAGAYLVTQ